MAKQSRNSTASAATFGYEAQLWQMADALRGSMDAAEYKHVTLGLLFLKYISDAFEEKPEARWPQLHVTHAVAAGTYGISS